MTRGARISGEERKRSKRRALVYMYYSAALLSLRNTQPRNATNGVRVCMRVWLCIYALSKCQASLRQSRTYVLYRGLINKCSNLIIQLLGIRSLGSKNNSASRSVPLQKMLWWPTVAGLNFLRSAALAIFTTMRCK